VSRIHGSKLIGVCVAALVFATSFAIGSVSAQAGKKAADQPVQADAGVAAVKPVAPPPAVAPPKRPHLRVAVAGSKPFVVRDAAALQGLSIDVWRALALQLKVTFDLKAYKRVSDAINAVKSGEMDVAIGPISITAKRAQVVDFTQPYYTASAGILAQSKPSSAWKRFKPLLSKVFLIGFIIMVIVLFIVGNLVWLAERGVNSVEYPRSYGPGVLAGMWFALVTMTTVGYGDKTPKTAAGKAVASVWMLIALLAMSSVTAGIATAFTLSQIQTTGISDMGSLQKRDVVAVKGTPGESLARRYRAKLHLVESKDDALAKVSSGQVEAMIYDYPVLKYYLYENPRLKLSAIQTTILSDNYGFATRRKSPWVQKMNLGLLNLRESGKVREIASQWSVVK